MSKTKEKSEFVLVGANNPFRGGRNAKSLLDFSYYWLGDNPSMHGETGRVPAYDGTGAGYREFNIGSDSPGFVSYGPYFQMTGPSDVTLEISLGFSNFDGTNDVAFTVDASYGGNVILQGDFRKSDIPIHNGQVSYGGIVRGTFRIGAGPQNYEFRVKAHGHCSIQVHKTQIYLPGPL